MFVFWEFWGLVWVKISFPVELQSVELSSVFFLLIRQLAVWKKEKWPWERDQFYLIIQTNSSYSNSTLGQFFTAWNDGLHFKKQRNAGQSISVSLKSFYAFQIKK